MHREETLDVLIIEKISFQEFISTIRSLSYNYTVRIYYTSGSYIIQYISDDLYLATLMNITTLGYD